MMRSLARLGLFAFIPAMVASLGAQAENKPEANANAKFDVITIRPSEAGQSGTSLYNGPGASIRALNMTVMNLIMSAYDVREYQIEGGPGWMKSDRFDVQGKQEEAEPSTMRNMTADQRRQHTLDQRQRMRNLLAERFALQIKRETKDRSGYLLVAAKNGPKLKPTAFDETHQSTSTNTGAGRASIAAEGSSLSDLAVLLSGILGITVIDSTGLAGRFDYKLEWTPDEAAAAGGDTESKGSLFTAIQDQLGLKLESKKVPTEIISIERLDQPSEN